MKNIIFAASLLLLSPVLLAEEKSQSIALQIAEPGKTVKKSYNAGKGITLHQVSSCPKEGTEGEYCSDKIFLNNETKAIIEIDHDGHGASGVGEDEITFGANWLNHQSSGGAGMRWTNEERYQLVPFKKTYYSGTNFYAGDPEKMQESETFPLEARSSTKTSLGEDCVLEKQSIPYIPSGTPESVDFNSCKVTPAYNLKGEDATPVSAVVIGNKLVVDIQKPKFVLEGKSWLSTDHLELWLAQSGTVGISDECPEGKSPEKGIAQWAIDLRAAKAIPAYNEPETLPEIKVTDVSGGKRAIITLPRFITLKSGRHFWFLRDRNPGITLALSTGDGKKQNALKATSTVKAGFSSTLGELQDFGCGNKKEKISGAERSLDITEDALLQADLKKDMTDKNEVQLLYQNFVKLARSDENWKNRKLVSVNENCPSCAVMTEYLNSTEKVPVALVKRWRKVDLQCIGGSVKPQTKELVAMTEWVYTIKEDNTFIMQSVSKDVTTLLEGKIYIKGNKFFEETTSYVVSVKGQPDQKANVAGVIREWDLSEDKKTLSVTTEDKIRSSNYCASGKLRWVYQ